MDTISLPSGITLPTAFGAPPAPLQPGQVIQALVLELIESDVFRLQLPQAVIDVRSDAPLTPGRTIMLAVKVGGANPRLVVYADETGSAPRLSAGAARPVTPVTTSPVATTPVATGQGSPPARLAVPARQPIGEAVIIARQPFSSQPKAAVDSAVPRDAPPIGAIRSPERPPGLAPVIPERALGEAVRSAAARQRGMAPLFADVEQAAAGGALPLAVRAAAQQVLALRVPLDETLTASDVKQAFMRSGVQFEPRLALPAQAAVSPQAAPQGTPTPASDLKAALLVFRQVLKAWSASAPERVSDAAPPNAPAVNVPVEAAKATQSAPPVTLPDDAAPVPQPEGSVPQRDGASPLAPQLSDAAEIKRLVNAVDRTLASAPEEFLPPSASAPLSPEQATNLAKSFATAMLARDLPNQPASVSSNSGPPPPYRGAPLTLQPPVAPSIAPDATPHETAERLIAATEGAVARTTLLQAASLPEQFPAPRADPNQRWSFEIPFVTAQGTGIAQFEVSRDGSAAQPGAQARVWRARFSLDVEPMGPVHALVALTGERASVTLWAERVTTATRLNDHAPELSEALRAAELEPADFQFRVGAPPVAAKQAAPGRFMDRAS